MAFEVGAGMAADHAVPTVRIQSHDWVCLHSFKLSHQVRRALPFSVVWQLSFNTRKLPFTKCALGELSDYYEPWNAVRRDIGLNEMKCEFSRIFRINFSSGDSFQ